MNRFFCFPTLIALAITANAQELKLASYFSDGAVVQRNQPVAINGKGPPAKPVEVMLGKAQGKTTVGADGTWRVQLPAQPAGGPFVLKASCDGHEVSAQEVMCGDVWLCSGQSNMQMGIEECENGPRVMAESMPNLRLLSMGRGGADQPKTTFDAKWQKATPETATKFAAVAYFFAHELAKDPALKSVPIGLINSSFGGTAAEAWTPKDEIAWETEDQRSGSMFGIPPSSLFNNMIAPLAPCGLSGVIWYQGEANAGKPEHYAKILGSLIQGWRKHFNQPDLPFLIVQLPPFADKMGPHYFTWLREAQATVAKTVPHCELVVSIDTTDGSDLHPHEKQDIGKRAALLARQSIYKSAVPAHGPVLRNATPLGKRLVLTFETFGRGLSPKHEGKLRGFEIAGADGVFYDADATLTSSEVLLESKWVDAPKFARYAWSAVPHADLVNGDGFPAAPFRTDTLPMTDIEFQTTQPMHRIAAKDLEMNIDSKGSVRSLGIGGQQFLSNALGLSGGTCFPGGFGAWELPQLEQVRANRLVFSNSNLAFDVVGENGKTEWNITNSGKDEAKLRMTLANEVTPTQENGSIRIERLGVKARIAGPAQLDKANPDGKPVITVIPAGKTVTLTIAKE